MRRGRLPGTTAVAFDDLANATMLVVVAVLYGERVTDRRGRIGRREPVLRVEGVIERPVARQISVSIIGGLNVEGRMFDTGILVQAIGRIPVRHAVGGRPLAVADSVVDVVVVVGADLCGSEFAAAAGLPQPQSTT